MADQTIDYEALAEQARKGTTSAGNPPAGIDYSALANQARGEMLEPISYRNGMPVYSIDVYGRAGPPPQPPVFQGTDEQGKPIIASPPGPPTPPMAFGLLNPQQQRAETPTRLNPRTGLPMTPMPMGTIPIIDAPYTGGTRAITGLEKIAGAQSRRDVAGGASEMLRGGLEAATPLLPGAFAAAPLATAVTLAAGTGLSTASEHTLNAIGVPKEYSALASDLIGLFGAGATYSKLRGLAKLPYVREANAIQAKLEEAIRQAKDPNATLMEQAAAKARVDALMQGLQQAEAGRSSISPQSAAAQAVIGQGAKYGVRLSAGDVSQRPTLKNIEVSAEKVPGMGMESFREKQQIEAKAAATRVKSQYEDALINAEPSSLAELQEAAEGGDQRARNVLEKMNQAGNDPDRIIQASIGLGDWTTRQKATWLYDRVQKLAEDHELGDVPMNSTGKAIGSSLQELRPAKLPNKEVIGLLQKVKESIAPKLDAEGKPLLNEQGIPVGPNNTYGLIRQLHSDLGERIREYYQGNNALIGEKGVGYLERVNNALEDDMRNYAKNSGVPEIVDAGQTADEYYKSARVPYKNGMLAAAATSNEPDQVFQQFIKAGKGDRAKNFYDALDDRGKAAVRYNMVAKAVDDSINPQSGIFSPQKFFTAVDKLDEAYGVFFTSKDKAEIEGFKNLMGHVTRAGQYAENPPTGQRVIPYLIAGGAAGAVPSAIAHPFLAGGGLALIGAARGLLTTARGRKLLLLSRGIKEGTPLMDLMWRQIGKEMPRLAGPSEGPSATGGGEPPPAGQAGGIRQKLEEGLKRVWGEEEGSLKLPRRRPADPIAAVSLKYLMENPLEVPGKGVGGQVKTVDMGREIRQTVRGGGGSLAPDSEARVRQARAEAAMVDDLTYALASQPEARKWYTGSVQEMEAELIKNRPEFQDPAKRSLFKYLLGVTSNGVDPELNFDAAMRGWDLYQEHGRFMAYDPSRASEFADKPGKVEKGTGLTFRANSYKGAMKLLDRLVQEKGEAGAVEWLKSKQTIAELKKYDPDITVGDGSPRYGSYVLGEKVGSFGANLNGIYTELTADKWWSRTWNRWMGTTMATNREGRFKYDKETGEPLTQDDPRNETERNLMRQSAANVAKDLNLTVAELQAVLWYAEQALYRAHGISAGSADYSMAAKKFFEKASKPSASSPGRRPAASPSPLPSGSGPGLSP